MWESLNAQQKRKGNEDQCLVEPLRAKEAQEVYRLDLEVPEKAM
jgi:hypothetical protein